MRIAHEAPQMARLLLEKANVRYKNTGGGYMNVVPVIDLAPFLSGNAAGCTQVVEQPGRAAEEIGFFSIPGQGVHHGTVTRSGKPARAA
jgi:hypothetical protein